MPFKMFILNDKPHAISVLLGETSKFPPSIRDWSLITGRGGATKREGGAREVLPQRKGGAEKVLAMLKGGRKKIWGSFYAVA